MIIERAKERDSDILTNLMRKSKAIWGYGKEQMEQWKDELTITKEQIRKNAIYNLKIDHQIIGFYSYKQQGGNLKLDSLFVHPQFIGKGIGKRMMEDFLDRTKPIPKKRIVLEADPNAVFFYEKYGFNTIALQKTSIQGRFMPIMVQNSQKLEDHSLFETDRLNVKHLSPEDIEGFYKMQSNPKVMQYIKPTMNYAESKKELQRFIGYYDAPHTMFQIWAVHEKRTDSFIGICGVYLNEHDEYEIAYRFQQSKWGMGFGSEIAKKLIRFCFETLSYDTLFAYVMEGNVGSRKILEKYMEYDREMYSDNTSSKEYVYRIHNIDGISY